MVAVDVGEVELDGPRGAPRDLHEAEARPLAALLGVGSELLLVENLQLLLAHVPDLAQPSPQSLDIGPQYQVAGTDHVVVALPTDGENAVPNLHERYGIGRRRRLGVHHLGGIADHVLHLLDENGEHAAQRLGIGIVDGKLLFQRLADAAQHRLRHVAAIGKDDALRVQHRPQIHQLTGKHRRLLGVRDKAKDSEIVAANLLTLILIEGLAQRFRLLAHWRMTVLAQQVLEAPLAEGTAARTAYLIDQAVRGEVEGILIAEGEGAVGEARVLRITPIAETLAVALDLDDALLVRPP